MVINSGLSVKDLRLQGMKIRYPDVTCPKCGGHVQNLIRHFKQSHSGSLREVYDLCSTSEDPEVLVLNQRVLRKRAEVHKTGQWDPNTSVVYFVQAGLAGRPVKIGHAQEMSRRIVSLQLGCPEPLEVLLAVAGERELERELHKRFAHLRIHQEWFRADRGLMSCILEMSQSYPVVPTRKRGDLNVRPKVRASKRPQLTYKECQEAAHRLGVTTSDHWRVLHQAGELPHGATWNPPRTYPLEWRGWSEFLGKGQAKKTPEVRVAMGVDRMLELARQKGLCMGVETG